MPDDLVKVSRDGAVATVVINRADKLNALNADVLRALGAAIDDLSANPELGATIITGAGKAFVAGADIGRFNEMSAEQARAFVQLGQSVFSAIESAACPVIAAVNGFALGGGCELALACDFIYASEKAKLGQPEVNLGIIPGFGGTQRLSRRVGIAMARELIYTARIIDAQEALRIGLVNRVVAAESLLDEAKATARGIASKAPLAIRAAKRALLQGEEKSLGEANRIEIERFVEAFDTQDRVEGVHAFLEKRESKFQRR